MMINVPFFEDSVKLIDRVGSVKLIDSICFVKLINGIGLS